MFTKISRFLLPALLLSGFAYSAIAEDLSVGLEGQLYSYQEHARGMRVMSLIGPSGGFTFGYHHNMGDHFVDLDMRTLFGVENYDGHLYYIDNPAVLIPYKEENSSHNHLTEVRVTYGMNTGDYRFYAGIGRRVKSDDPLRSHYGSRRMSSYWYLPLGLKIPTSIYNIEAIPYIEYDLFLVGHQMLDDSGVTSRQAKGLGLRTGAAFRFKQYTVTPYINYWRVDDSEPKRGFRNYYMYEPKNMTLELGCRLSYAF